MTSNGTLRLVSAGMGATLLLLGACGDDTSKGEPDPGGEVEGDGATPSPSIDGGIRGMDGSIPVRPPVNVDGSITLPSADGSVPTEPPVVVAPVDGGLPVSLSPLPADGTKLSTCYTQADCNGDDLTCVSAAGVFGAGFCNDDCAANEDCSPVGGVASQCTIEGQCVFDCAGAMGAGDGMCPPDMACRNVVPPGVLAFPVYRCTYPLGAGSKAQSAYEKCDINHGGGDCAGVSSCHVPVGDLVTVATSIVGPGYCAPVCMDSMGCSAPAGVTAAPFCMLGACELDCSGAGATCPTGMNCRDVNELPLVETLRCRFIN